MNKRVAVLLLAVVCTLCACATTTTKTKQTTPPNNTPTSTQTQENVPPAVCSHSWNNATCIAPKTCALCGVTDGAALGHSWKSATCTDAKTCKVCGTKEGAAAGHKYSSGKCTSCGAKDPNVSKIKEALSNSKRYVTYLELESEILLSKIDLYKITGKTKDLLAIQESVSEIASYYSKIYGYCSPYQELYTLYSDCTDPVPLVTSSNMAKIKTYATQAGRVDTVYNILCNKYGVA